MKLKEIHRTSTFAWAPSSSLPLLATGSVAGALDESFSNESQLEIWAPDFLDKLEYDLGSEGQHGPKAFVTDNARFNRLAWGDVDGLRPRGVIAAGMENGELVLWDPEHILNSEDALVLRNTQHHGPVRGLDFNPIQKNLLATGATQGEVYVWDLKDPSKPYSPTGSASRSTKLEDITSVKWNQQVQYVLAGASTSGYTVVWDLRGKREVVALAYGGGAGTLAGQNSGSGMAMGGRRGMSDIAWHPDNATRLVTASEDDSSPIIMVWDLRNARAPEKILTGHEKGVLSLSWCKQDADLLLSCGKDNRALCWNPQTSEIIGELPSADNWAFQVDWCPRNPDLLATAFFDGTIGIHSLQSTNDASGGLPAITPKPDGSDIFNVPGFGRASHSGATLSLKQPPKWLRRPASSSFGFGGKLISVSNLPSAQGQNQSSVIHLRKVVTESEIVERAKKLQEAIVNDKLSSFAEEKSEEMVKKDGWKALLSLFRANSRDELVTLLGFSREEVAIRVAEAIENLKSATAASTLKSPSEEEDITESKPHEPVVSFLEPEREDASDGEYTPGSAGVEKTPSEVSASVTSDATSGIRHADGESTTTVPSLFGDDNGPGTPQHGAGVDFFNTISQNDDIDSRQVLVPHTNYGLDSSVAATIGSGPSSVTSETIKANGFRIYPADESEIDRLVTKALVLGDFESAVSLCLSSDRYADAILLAVKGGKELLERTQKAYFQRQTTSFPYLRLFQSIVTNDLADIVQNADLQEWQEIFVVLCTFATQEEFSQLAEQLGGRLEFESSVSKEAGGDALAYRKNATLTYLAAGRLERLVNIWMEELVEEEREYATDGAHGGGSLYAAHAYALQTLIEKVTVFRSAIKYVDADLSVNPADTAAVTGFKLSNLYDRYFEYADILASQGLIDQAAAYLKLVPDAYQGSGSEDLSSERDRLLKASSSNVAAAARPTFAASTVPAALPSIPTVPSYSTYPSQVPAIPAVPSTNSIYSTYTPMAPAGLASNSSYAPAQPINSQPLAYQSIASSVYAPPAQNNSYNSLTQPPHQRQQQPQPVNNGILPPPPPRLGGTPNLPPPPPKRDEGGWNDAPTVLDRRPPSVAPNGSNKPAAITSPFPNAAISPIGSPFMSPGQPQSVVLPPPPRPGSVQAHSVPPPSQSRMQPPLAPGSQAGIPSHVVSPPQVQPPFRQMTPSQYAQPPVRATPPPPVGGFVRPPPGAPMQPGAPLQQNPYARAISPAQQPPPNPYAPPPSAQRPAPPAIQSIGQPAGGVPPQQMQPPLQNVAAPPRGPSNAPPAPSRAQRAPPPPKYPTGDRSHIPESDKPAFIIISQHLERLKQTTPPQQKRMADDLERRINPLFDALNCETLSRPVVDRLLAMTAAMQAHDRPAALSIHMDLLTKGSATDDIGLWMSGVKQLIMKL